MTVPFSLPLFTVAAVQSARASLARREEEEADDQRYATLRREQAQFRPLDDKPLLVDEPMIEQNHPITPPPELVQQWVDDFAPMGMLTLATQAARWGADQELEACEKWVASRFDGMLVWSATLRAARRPKPPSLAKRALHILGAHGDLSCAEHDTIRKALEQLND
jgi:hypothetical protein